MHVAVCNQFKYFRVYFLLSTGLRGAYTGTRNARFVPHLTTQSDGYQEGLWEVTNSCTLCWGMFHGTQEIVLAPIL